MREAMEAITDKDETLENKLVAFDNLEMLCEGLDNAVRMITALAVRAINDF